jgi:hypothetical protein
MTDIAAELAKLGTAGPARVDAVQRWMDASGLSVWKSGMVTAAQVEQMERHMAQGGGATAAARFSQSHTAAPAGNKIPGYEGMSFEQRRLAQDTIAARRGR